ncbi:MAG: hypothetical protein M1414_01860 [Candidatus Thermoplasmatota archaeon]|jgi:transposase|nr:hypothetical protein [Candidatus Thermoplasmatota archaeon]
MQQAIGTGYSLTIKKNYESHAKKLEVMAKENSDHGKDAKESKIHKKSLFAYSFAIMDLESRMYRSGSSMESEREAYDRANGSSFNSGDGEGLNTSVIQYYSSHSYMDKLGNTKVFVIPKNTLH